MLTTSTCDIQKLFSVACLPGEAHCSIKIALITANKFMLKGYFIFLKFCFRNLSNFTPGR